MRICEKCGWENADPETDSDVWCEKCSNFLGFPVKSRVHERRISMQLVNRQASVLPGGEATLTARVRNSGDIVEKVTFAVEGDIAGWTLVEPTEVGLFPNQTGEVQLVFRPPRSSQVGCGLTPFGLLATSESDATVSDSADGSLDIGAFVDVRTALTPLQSAGPSGAEHRLDLENAGNTVIDVRVSASQPGDELSFTITPESVQLAPGAKGDARVEVSPREALYDANDKRHSFTVSAVAAGQSPITIRAIHVQEAPATSPTLVLAEARIHAAPGKEVTTMVTVRNRGRGGEDYSFELLGPAASWGRVSPPTIVLPSGGELEAKIVFAPPLVPPAPASEIPFAVRCASQVDAKRSTVAEAVLIVDAVSDINFEVEPTRVRARWSSRHIIEVENRGNATAELRPVIVDPNHDLAFAVSPRVLHLPPGGRQLVVFKARVRRPKLLGASAARSCQVFFTPAAGGRAASRGDGAGREVRFEQIAVLPSKLVALVVIIALVGALSGVASAIFSMTSKTSPTKSPPTTVHTSNPGSSAHSARAPGPPGLVSTIRVSVHTQLWAPSPGLASRPIPTDAATAAGMNGRILTSCLDPRLHRRTTVSN